MTTKDLIDEKDKYISVEETCRLLEINDEEIQHLVQNGKLHAFKIGERYLRFRKDQVSEIKAKWRINRELFPDQETEHSHVLVADKDSWFDYLKDLWYFNDFYIGCCIILAALLYLILASQ